MSVCGVADSVTGNLVGEVFGRGDILIGGLFSVFGDAVFVGLDFGGVHVCAGAISSGLVIF